MLDVIDCSVGEAYIVRNTLFEVFKLHPYEMPQEENMWLYPNPQGYKQLVSLLEHKYNAPIIITNGAKQALCATSYALNKMGKKTLWLRKPYWALIPPVIRMHGLEVTQEDNYDSYLCVSPNNPCGYVSNLKEEYLKCKNKNIPFIHDGVYYNKIYMPSSYKFESIGDVQIFSAAKSFGLSSLRVGWAVCHNQEFFTYFKEYMDLITVGAPITSQMFLYHILNMMRGYPTLKESFESISRSRLLESKNIAKQINPSILEIPEDFDNLNGMFLMAKCHKPEAFNKAGINAAWGEAFGAPGYVRMNLAFPKEKMQSIVDRLNNTII